MNLKEYFKPDERKIRITFLLLFLNILIFFISTSLISTALMPLYLSYYYVLLLLFKFPLIMISILLFLGYFFACYISKSKMLVIGAVLYFVSVSVLSMGIMYGIDNWNNTSGISCDSDSDCHYLCGHGIAVTNKYIELERWSEIGCEERDAVCENGKCKKIIISKIDIISVWNNSGKISFEIKNRGDHVVSEEKLSQFDIYIDGEYKEMPSYCAVTLNKPDTACQIDTDTDFPTVYGLDSAVQIDVVPPYAGRETYICAIPTSGEHHETC